MVHVSLGRASTFRVVTFSACRSCLTLSIACSSSDIDVHASNHDHKQMCKHAFAWQEPRRTVWVKAITPHIFLWSHNK